MPRADTVDAYLAALPENHRATLRQLRETIRAAAPAAIEVIAYNMPALRLGRRFLISYDVYQGHTSLFPASRAVRDALGTELFPYRRARARSAFPPAGRFP